MKKLFSPLNLVLALALTLFIIAAAVVVTLNFRPLYYLDVDLLNIPASVSYTHLDVYKRQRRRCVQGVPPKSRRGSWDERAANRTPSP